MRRWEKGGGGRAQREKGKGSRMGEGGGEGG